MERTEKNKLRKELLEAKEKSDLVSLDNHFQELISAEEIEWY